MFRELIYFKPANQFIDKQEFTKVQDKFHTGELDEDYAQYCVKEAVHAFWFNYKDKPNKCDKELFN